MRAAPGISHAPGTRTTSMSLALRPAAQQGIQSSIQQPFGDHRIPARHHDSELHPRSRKIALDGDRLAFYRIAPRPEAKRKSRLRLDREDTRLPVGLGDRRERRWCGAAALCLDPCLGCLVYGVECRHLHQHIGGGRELAFDNFEVAQRRQESCAPAVRLVPAFTACESQRRQKARHTVVGRLVLGWAQERNGLDHASILSCGMYGSLRGAAGREANKSPEACGVSL